MELVHKEALIRGAAILDYAYGDNISVSESIGIIAAYFARGGSRGTMRADLTDRLNDTLVDKIASIYSLFKVEGRDGLWVESPQHDGVLFTSRKLLQRYPLYANSEQY